jgi:hypothetical protein
MDTVNDTNNNVKDNWEDSSESEQEEEQGEEDIGKNINVKNSIDRPNDRIPVTHTNGSEYDNEEWDFYEGYSPCSNCGKYSDARIIMIESKRIFCYDACLDKDEIYDDGDDDDYDYDDLEEYDRKLGLAVSCRGC